MTDLLAQGIERSVWWGWGDPAQGTAVPAGAVRLLRDELGVELGAPPTPPVALSEVRLRDSRLSAEDRRELAELVGERYVRTDRLSRVVHAGGKSYPDLYRRRTGDAENAPDAVIEPGDEGQVAAVMAWCVAHDVAIVPFGGGTTVVGGVEPDDGGCRAVVCMELCRFDAVVDVDRVSMTATLGAGLRGPDVERVLRPHGFTLGHYPQSHQEATLGGYVATRSAGQASTGYGRLDDLVLGVRMVTPAGTVEFGNRAPATAAGPDLLGVAVGSEGAYGVITQATVAVAPYPKHKVYGAWSFPDFATGAEALRRLGQQIGKGSMPQVCRLSDAEETRVQMAVAGRVGKAILGYLSLRGQRTPCLALFVWEGDDRGELVHRRRRADRVLGGNGALSMPGEVAKAWERHRFSGPYLRDALMDHGVLAETLETAATWRRLPEVYRRVQEALTESLNDCGTPPSVQCHISHVYRTGASLYYTFVARAAEDPLAQWHAAKDAASAAIVEAGGTITHHHSVGTYHRPFLAEEVGELGISVLAAIKGQFDPEGVLNPGKLVASWPRHGSERGEAR